MGITASILTQIEIRSPPATVRAVFLDIQAHQAWQTNFIITPQSPASDPEPLAVGKKLNVQIGSATFNPVIQVNNAEMFQWEGRLPLVFSGAHRFEFRPSTTTPGGTTLIQGENFRGLLAFLMKEGWSTTTQTKANFTGFNEKIKARAESMST